ncbi:hypothetical protein PTT_08303 [Pyrenophora teres f. teres 0-1]|uniref:DUF895 domain membrane protein n=1 Tax=Pyrenophora teres f. teres (strain 0-1) TaxID=861557 RepID=E3RJH9_PYRTT|nr:hypothetical protein PTT_08303 [Pyrenophora teres f. teres 0-1]
MADTDDKIPSVESASDVSVQQRRDYPGSFVVPCSQLFPVVSSIPVLTTNQQTVRWYRSTFFNITILGLCNFSAPGIWGAMNSLGAGGAQSPHLVNAGNSLTFCLMVVSCYFSSVIVKYVGIKGALMLGTVGYAPYAAALYTNNRFGTEWFIYLGSSLCGLSAGLFWMAEAAIAIAYPEPWNKGKALGYWLTYRLAGQILGGAINLGLNADRDQAGKVTYTVYLVFIALQCIGPVVGWFLNKPDQVERQDGKKVVLRIAKDPWFELKETARLFLWFSVRARALGSFLSGIIAVICGNLLGAYLDRTTVALRTRARTSFFIIAITQGAWWLWATILVTQFRDSRPTYDWASHGFGRAFAVFIFLTVGFQLNYLFLYFVIGNLAEDEEQVIRYAALLRGTESAWQAVSYGVTSIKVFAEVGAVYWNFALWGLSLWPAWVVISGFGERLTAIEQVDDDVVGRDRQGEGEVAKL